MTDVIISGLIEMAVINSAKEKKVVGQKKIQLVKMNHTKCFVCSF